MSNTRKTTAAKSTAPAVYSVDRYTREAALDPFELVVDAEHTIAIEPPNGAALDLFAKAASAADSNAMLMALTGDAYPEVKAIFDRLPYGATMSLMEDLNKHFGLDTGATEVVMVGPTGLKVTESDPKKIEDLYRLGWRLGE